MSEPAVVLPALSIARPEPGEYAPYYDRYISLIPGTEILATLESQRRQMMLLLSGRDEADGDFRYAPDKWSAKQVLGHVCDTERIFAYRALRIARGDQTPMEGFEQDDWVRDGLFERRSLADLTEEFRSVRAATFSLFQNFSDEVWMRTGTANNNTVSVRALAYIIAGHELHHRRILREKYFTQKPAA